MLLYAELSVICIDGTGETLCRPVLIPRSVKPHPKNGIDEQITSTGQGQALINDNLPCDFGICNVSGTSVIWR